MNKHAVRLKPLIARPNRRFSLRPLRFTKLLLIHALAIFAALHLMLGIDPAGRTLAAGTQVITTGVAVNNSSAVISFRPVNGARDYRIYDVANPMMVKYAGQVHIDTGNAQYWSMQSDGLTADFPFLALQEVPYPFPAGNATHIDVPSTQIEWNGLGDHQPHTLVIEAVDKLGPAPMNNLYNTMAPDPIMPMNLMPDSQLGVNEGMTADGKMSINGQGDPNNSPNVIASSQPLTVTASGSYKPIPSGPDASQTFLDTFENSEANALKLVDQGNGGSASANTNYMDYTLNQGLPNAWNIKFQAIDTRLSRPFIDMGHFMDVIFDEHASGSWATMAMAPQRNADLTGGRILHMTMEVDPEFDAVLRRWVGFDLAPASDPLTNWKEIEFSLGKQPNATDQALFINVYRNKVVSNLYTGPTSSTNPSPVKVIANSIQNPQWPWMTGVSGGAAALDKRSRFDLFATTKHVAIFENGSLLTQYDLPNGGLPYSIVSPSFSHYYYHSGAEISELNTHYPHQPYFTNVFPYSDERHWDNMGFEVLPASDVPAGNDFHSLASRAQPVLPAQDACPSGFSCGDTGPVQVSGNQHVDASGWTIRGGDIEYPVNSQGDAFRFIYQPTSAANISARVTSIAHTAWGAEVGGVMVRQSTQWLAPMYGVFAHRTGTVHVEYRAAQGGPMQDVDTGVPSTMPLYLRATSSGNAFAGFWSSNGTTWQQLPKSSLNIAMGSTVLQGLAGRSASNLLGEATFDSVMINGVPGR